MKNRIQEIREAKGLSQRKLGDMLNSSGQQIGKLESGQRRLSTLWMDRLASALGVDPIELITESPSTGLKRVPILSWVQAGTPTATVQDSDCIDYELIEIEGNPKDLFALRVKGNSMNRVAVEGSIIVVDRNQRDLTDGKAYICCDENHDTTFKRYRETPPRLEPDSTDPHDTIFELSNWQIIGRVVLAISKTTL